jgi:predicted RecB family nuclease
VRIEQQHARVYQTLEAFRKSSDDCGPPPVILNRHCATCDFQPECRRLAIAGDDLSLLSAMTEKERAKLNSKGILTITQLSYSYRPRRRKGARLGGPAPDTRRTAFLIWMALVLSVFAATTATSIICPDRTLQLQAICP